MNATLLPIPAINLQEGRQIQQRRVPRPVHPSARIRKKTNRKTRQRARNGRALQKPSYKYKIVQYADHYCPECAHDWEGLRGHYCPCTHDDARRMDHYCPCGHKVGENEDHWCPCPHTLRVSFIPESLLGEIHDEAQRRVTKLMLGVHATSFGEDAGEPMPE